MRARSWRKRFALIAGISAAGCAVQPPAGDPVAGDWAERTLRSLTLRQKAFVDMRYSFAGVSFWYHLEYLNKDVFTTKPNELDFTFRHIVRSLAMVSASF